MTKKTGSIKESGVTLLTLFTSTGTLVCCALPIMLVSFGLGASVAAMTSSFPFLIVLSQHKIWVFVLSALMLTLSGWVLYRPGRSCTTDPELGKLCEKTRRWNLRLYWSSVVILTIGFLAAYVALPVRIWLGF